MRGAAPRLVVFAVALAALAMVPGSADSSTLHLYGAGARSVGMAGAHEAIASNYLATWASPANLALSRRPHVGIGAHVVLPHFAIDRTTALGDYPSALPQDSVLGHIGVSSPIGGPLRDRVAIGIHLHIPMSGPTRLAARDFRTPQVALYDAIENRLAVNMGLAGRVTDWLCVGASFQLLAALEGTANFSLSVLDRRFNQRALHIDLFSSLSPNVSVLALPTKSTRLSLVWRAEASVAFDLPVQVAVEQVGLLQFHVSGTGLFTPHQLVLAAAQDVGAWTLTAAVTWAMWSRLPPMAPSINLDVDSSVLASRSGDPRLIAVTNVPIAMGAADILEPRAGAEWRANDVITARFGARFRPTLLPKADGIANYLDAPAWTFAAGVSFSLRDHQDSTRAPLTVDLGAGWTTLQRRTVVKRDPADPVGPTSLHGGNLRFVATLHHDF